MTTASVSFLAFAAAFAVLYNIGRPILWRQGVLFVANVCFLLTFSLDALSYLPFGVFLTIAFGSTWLVQRTRSRRLTWLLLLIIVAIFCWLKKYWFAHLFGFLTTAYVTVGLSYVLFRTLHVLIDAQAGILKVSPVPYVNYVLNFTTLVSGPIQRYQDFVATQMSPRQPTLSWIDAGCAIERIALGFFKMVVLAPLAEAAHERGLEAFGAGGSLLSVAMAASILISAYAVYLYFNFSGYTDIVIGVARFFRLELPENFDRPFSATNFIEFWTRWHMSLSNWFKIYFYNPLLKSLMERFPAAAVEPFLGVAAFMVTFFLIGLWHGPTVIFAVYGLVLGVGVSVNKLYQIACINALGRKRYRTLASHWLYQTFARGLTFTWLAMSLICFWADWIEIQDMAQKLGVTGIVMLWMANVIGAGIVLASLQVSRDGALKVVLNGSPVLWSRYVRTVWVTAVTVIAAAALGLLASPAPDVVYKVF